MPHVLPFVLSIAFTPPKMALYYMTKTYVSVVVIVFMPVLLVPPQFPQDGQFGARGKMDKCTFCAGGPEPDHSDAEFNNYGRNRLAEGKLPLCAEMCSTKALLAGDSNIVADLFRERVVRRQFNGLHDDTATTTRAWGWDTAYQDD